MPPPITNLVIKAEKLTWRNASPILFECDYEPLFCEVVRLLLQVFVQGTVMECACRPEVLFLGF